MKKLLGIGVVMMLATAATSHAVGGEWSCNTTCLDAWGYEYIMVHTGSSVDDAYQGLSCQDDDTVTGPIDCWPEEDLAD